MNDHILNDCLTRIAAGESVASCLARYPNAAVELEPHLRIAAMLQEPKEQISADDDATIEANLLTAFRAKSATSPPPSSRYRLQPTRKAEKFRQINRESIRGWLTVGNMVGFALAIVMLIGGGWLLVDGWQVQEVAPFAQSQPTEPNEQPTATVQSDALIEPDVAAADFERIELFDANVAVAAILPEAQEMVVYDVRGVPVSAEILLDIAQRLNIPDPQIYTPNDLVPGPTEGMLLIGSNGETLQTVGATLISYTNLAADLPTDADALTDTAAFELAFQFFTQIDLLPETYQFQSRQRRQLKPHLKQIQLTPLLNDHPLHVDGYETYATVHPSGAIVSALFSQFTITDTGRTQQMPSAQAFYGRIQNGKSVTNTVLTLKSPVFPPTYQYVTPLLTTVAAGDVVEVSGQLRLFNELDNPDALRLILRGDNGVTYLLRDVAVDALQQPFVRISGTAIRTVHPHLLEISVATITQENEQAWLRMVCDEGTTQWVDEVVLFTEKTTSADYRLNHVPSSFRAQDVQLCHFGVDADQSLDWFSMETQLAPFPTQLEELAARNTITINNVYPAYHLTYPASHFAMLPPLAEVITTVSLVWVFEGMSIDEVNHVTYSVNMLFE